MSSPKTMENSRSNLMKNSQDVPDVDSQDHVIQIKSESELKCDNQIANKMNESRSSESSSGLLKTKPNVSEIKRERSE